MSLGCAQNQYCVEYERVIGVPKFAETVAAEPVAKVTKLDVVPTMAPGRLIGLVSFAYIAASRLLPAESVVTRMPSPVRLKVPPEAGDSVVNGVQ